MSIVTNNIASNLLDGIIGVNETRRNYDSSTDERRCLSLTVAQLAEYKAAFPYNVGTLSDGNRVRLDESEICLRIPTNIGMFSSVSSEESYVYRSSDRAALNKPAIIAYVDGLKIPDSEVLFYPMKSNVDVFVPLKYFNLTNGSKVIFEKRCYDLVPYIRQYYSSTSGQSFSIPLTAWQYENSTFHERTVMAFVNKKLYTGSKSVSILNKSALQISFFQEISNAELEIIVDSKIRYYLPGTAMASGKKAVFEIPETYLDSIHGPLSRFSCYFFSNGKRLMNSDVIQKGRLHFEYDMTTEDTPILSVYVSDRGYIPDSDLVLYGCDYYLYNMIGVSAISNGVRGLSNTVFDGHIDFDEVLNKSGSLFDRLKLNSMLDTYTKLTTPGTKASYLLQDRPYLMRDFLSEYGIQTYNYTVDYNGSDPFVYIGLPNTVELADNRTYDISINTYHIPANEVEIISKDITDVFKIDSKFFNAGENTVEIESIDEVDIEYKAFEPSDISEENGYHVAVVSTFKRVTSEEDIIVLEKISGNDAYSYPTSKNIGYVQKSDVTIYLDDATGYVHVLFETLPGNTVLIYSKRFSCSYNYTKPLTSSVLDITIPIYSGSVYNPIPYIPRGKVHVYAGGEKLISGIDYFLKHPENEPTVAGSFIVVTRAILPGTEFNIYFTSIKTTTVTTYTGYFKNNPYGLFYLGNLKYPVSLDYMNIFLNGKKLTPSDVDILSDKLIRVHSLKTPMYDLLVETAFTVENSDLAPYVALYKEDAFEIFIAFLFKGVWYDRPDDLTDTTTNDFNATYETFVPSVDSVNRVKNPTAREEEWIPASNTNSTKIGVFNNGAAMGGEDINTSIIIGGYYIVAGNKGRVASENLANYAWSTYASGLHVSQSGSFVNNANITCSVFYKSYLIFGTDAGTIGYYNFVTKTWYGAGEAASPININKLTSDIFPTAIRKMVVDEANSLLIIVGDGGNVASFKFTENLWIAYSDKLTKKCASISGIMENIYDAYITTISSKNVLVVMGSLGNIASCKIQDNSWVKPNGILVDVNKPAPSIYHDGSSRSNKAIYTHTVFLDLILLSGEDGVVSTYNTDTGVYLGPSDIDSRSIVNSGAITGGEDTSVFLTYDDTVIVGGSNLGRISSYVGSNESWRSYNHGSGISDSGTMMDNCDVHTIAYTMGDTNYIIFAGAKGKVCTYNVDVHEVPYRYDPYKTAFLVWFNTPGEATINTEFDITSALCSKFSMYKDIDDTNFDITIAGGDVDLIADIDMNDRGRYPAALTSRTEYMANFIESLPAGRYTCDEVWALYMASKHHNILYPEDVIPLSSGDPIDSNEEINLTN